LCCGIRIDDAAGLMNFAFRPRDVERGAHQDGSLPWGNRLARLRAVEFVDWLIAAVVMAAAAMLLALIGAACLRRYRLT